MKLHPISDLRLAWLTVLSTFLITRVNWEAIYAELPIGFRARDAGGCSDCSGLR